MAASPTLSILTSIYRGEEYLADFLAQVAAQSIFPQAELVAVLNEGTAVERGLLKEFGQQHPGQLQVLEVEWVETLGASWNRAWRAARGDYLAIWNIDDRRTLDSLARQAAALEAHPDWALSYGDYLAVPAYGAEEGRRRHTPPYSSSAFRRAFPQGGAFWVLRAELAEKAGYFDEQFTVAADFDLSLRVAMRGLKMGRVDGLLGYFTDAEQGLSTREDGSLSSLERTVLQQRYAIYDKMPWGAIHLAGDYDLDAIHMAGKKIPLPDFIPPLEK